MHIQGKPGQGIRNNTGAHSGVTRVEIPDTWAGLKWEPKKQRSAGQKGRQRRWPKCTVTEWNVTLCARYEKFSNCILIAS
jgi:hypothetical protein